MVKGVIFFFFLIQKKGSAFSHRRNEIVLLIDTGC